jgi:signal peptidase I
MYFALFMVVILVITGLIWLMDILLLRKKRAAGQEDPWYVEYAKSFFPVILLVFVLRSFLVEPFKIPSGSMMPTLLAGDYILVNKFTYGLRVPILNNTIIEMNKPKRGDVIVFHYPSAPSVDYIKRVIGVPGDVISYQDKQLTVNGKLLNTKALGQYEYEASGSNIIAANRITEELGDIKHDILNGEYPIGCNEPSKMPKSFLDNIVEAAIGVQVVSAEICETFARNENVVVPAGHYLAMGDNRDNSSDSRMWGFVPERNLVGKAFFIWMNFDEFGRIGSSIK